MGDKRSKKAFIGILLGAVVGVVDVLPMVIQRLAWNTNLSAFFHWIIVGFFIATGDLKIKGFLKGLLVSVITLIPIAFLVWWNDVSSIFPMCVSTIVFGVILGYLIDKYEK